MKQIRHTVLYSKWDTYPLILWNLFFIGKYKMLKWPEYEKKHVFQQGMQYKYRATIKYKVLPFSPVVWVLIAYLFFHPNQEMNWKILKLMLTEYTEETIEWRSPKILTDQMAYITTVYLSMNGYD